MAHIYRELDRLLRLPGPQHDALAAIQTAANPTGTESGHPRSFSYGHTEKTDREKFSRLRQTLLHLACEIKGLVEPLFSDRPVIKGTVYELRRRCGKPGCKCARGDLHRSMVVSASEGGKTRLQVIPDGFLVEVQVKVRRYQELRRVRARLGEIHRQMLRVMDEMEGMRREDLSRCTTHSSGFRAPCI